MSVYWAMEPIWVTNLGTALRDAAMLNRSFHLGYYAGVDEGMLIAYNLDFPNPTSWWEPGCGRSPHDNSR